MNIRLRYGLILLIIVLAGIFVAPADVFPSDSRIFSIEREIHLSVLLAAISLGLPVCHHDPGRALPTPIIVEKRR